MTAASVISLDGLVDPTGPLTVSTLLDRAVVDVEGRILVPMVDVLAMMRLDADADIVLASHRGGASSALTVRQIVENRELYLFLQIRRRVGGSTASVVPRLWSLGDGPSAPVESLRALTFAAFVGQS